MTRRARPAIAVLAAVLVIALIAGIEATRGYQPLTLAITSSCCADDPSPIRSTRFVGGALKNEGRLDVRILDVDAPPDFEVRLDMRRVPEQAGSKRGVRPFRPFKLRGDAWRWVALLSRLPGCDREPNAYTTFRSVPVSFEFLNGRVSRTIHLDLHVAVNVGQVEGRRCSFVRDVDRDPI